MGARLATWLTAPPRWAIDWAPVAILPPVLVIDALISRSGRPLTVLNFACAVLVCVPLAFRRRLAAIPLVVLAVAGVVLVLWQLHPGNTVVLIPIFAVYELARRMERRRLIWIGVACVPGVLVGVLPFTRGLDHIASIVVRNLVLCLLAIGAGDLVSTRREMSERAADLREQETLRRVADERLAIAHEIHDVVAHGMTAINVQAGVAAHLVDRDPEQARRALRDIKRVSGAALAELRGTLDALRDPAAAAPLSPAGELAALDGLVAGARAAGLSVQLEVAELGALPPAVQHAGYRIVQEALTNVARHGGARRARVVVARDADGVAIEVADDGGVPDGIAAAGDPAPGAPGDGPAAEGNGIRGMRERARALGGTLAAGREPAGGWAVRARLPLAAAAPPPVGVGDAAAP